jgi:hypothetical protein
MVPQLTGTSRNPPSRTQQDLTLTRAGRYDEARMKEGTVILDQE